jgi:membrane associated rhomboid family serine protease
MIPVSDDNPTVETPWMTYLIVAVTSAVWLIYQGAGFDVRLLESVCNLGMVPAELTRLRPVGFSVPMTERLYCAVDDSPVNWITPVTTMFLHGGWGHIIGNMWFFWVFGNNIEDAMGPRRFVVFYLVCGVIASAAHVLTAPSSAIPTVGASGAVSGIMGAYLVLHPKARVNLLFYFLLFFRIIPVPAWAALLWWFSWQVISTLPALQQADDMSGGVAFAAHIGGFIAGVVLIRLFAIPTRLEQQRVLHNARYPARPVY